MIRLTEQQIARIVELRERGRSFQAIANAVGCSRGAARWQCLRLGAEPPKPGRFPLTPTAPVTIKRGKHVIRKFTTEDDALLTALDIQGFSLSVIARRMGRRVNSILGRLMTLARHDALAEARLCARVGLNRSAA